MTKIHPTINEVLESYYEDLKTIYIHLEVKNDELHFRIGKELMEFNYGGYRDINFVAKAYKKIQKITMPIDHLKVLIGEGYSDSEIKEIDQDDTSCIYCRSLLEILIENNGFSDNPHTDTTVYCPRCGKPDERQ